ncbi:hypothetical protein TSUD_232280 [Trifolium subterraneum]|uniref:Uncharacterized protein n=1 Tax=Trifolium subterraneum TaxID=3900 RepID=A0A2Z6LN02_TRISU|nr:hypothetical protein TSUD_232280 [Trifolium subterraneum]
MRLVEAGLKPGGSFKESLVKMPPQNFEDFQRRYASFADEDNNKQVNQRSASPPLACRRSSVAGCLWSFVGVPSPEFLRVGCGSLPHLVLISTPFPTFLSFPSYSFGVASGCIFDCWGSIWVLVGGSILAEFIGLGL